MTSLTVADLSEGGKKIVDKVEHWYILLPEN